jgi:hypothetical protein
MTLIGLCGYARVGKDECCKALGFARAAYADALKAAVDPLFPADTPKEIRRPMYVEYGRAMRQIDPDHWIDLLLLSRPPCCVTDVRYLNEVQHIESLGGIVIRIRRPGYGPANPEEARSFAEIERARPAMPCVRNDGTPEEMAARVRGIIGHYAADPTSA